MSNKTCSSCNKDFNESQFLKGRFKCKDCRSSQRKENYIKNQEKLQSLSGNKKCITCNVEKDIKQFKVGNNKCSECINEYRRNKRLENIVQAPSIYNEVVVPDGFKLCKSCMGIRQNDYFRKNRLKCKPCENTERVDYKNGIKPKYNKPTLEIAEDELSKRLKASCRWRIRETLPSEIAKQYTEQNRFGYIYDLLNCDMEHLKKWLKYCYDSQMNDNNYGTYWFMDHVIPLHTFDIKNNFEKCKNNCYSWYNISPLNAIANNQKFVGIDKKQLETHITKLKDFCAKNNLKVDDDYILLCATHLGAGTS